MPFLIFFVILLFFSIALPKTFKVFYALFMSIVFTLGPAGMLSVALGIMGIRVPFSLVCGGCFVFIAVPFIIATMPGSRYEAADEDD
jgi:hypothetical protein